MLTQLRWSAFGLRGRIVGAVLVTTVVTLAIAGVGLLPKLESQLRTASKATLKRDVGKPVAKADIRRFAGIHYADIPSLNVPALHHAAHLAQNALNDAEGSLGTQLGATFVILFGYVDQTGHGRVVFPDPDTASGANGTAFFPELARAYLSRQTLYSFGSIGSTQYVRAAIPVRKDDAVVAVYKSIDEIPGAVHVVARAFSLAALAGLFLTLLLAIPLAATLVRRLQRLREAALRIAVEGVMAEVPVDRARDEVGDLARSFSIMQHRLLQQEEARRAFVATASHELRTPLASLDGMLELLAEDLRDETPDLEDATELLERARVQSRRLGRLAADLLDLSRLDADVALRSEPVELGELSRAVLAEFELASRERGVRVALHDGEPTWALADPGSVARILRILLDNALRVAPRDSQVTVTLSSTPTPALSVSDCGPGVAAEEQTVIFERFKRGRDTGREAGFGLGLAIGRELAKRMDGDLILREASRPGATFTLTLPATHAPTEDRVTSVAGV